MTASSERPSAEYDAILEACRHPVRRAALATLLAQRGSITLTELAESIEANAAGVTDDEQERSSDTDDRSPSTLPLMLHHTHLPKLAEACLVEYDTGRGVAEPTAEFDRVRSQVSTIVAADPALEAPIVG
ncbi:hypothetical protein Halru_2325 [Halovivax ruber XH-70]|uniref:DUF7344 domain-containing protein n=1 Tax=Halovivax ruber (strain DSM 18193 / JCM 13892 / XH-70) TaxID=797302 RepID=L0IBH3_HALRX|nr:hypothetical protein [Halovivax ruber]AGB16910.1 hypothetical protein Halru_2325 [Halovivax ruber XH-70]